MVVLRIVSGLVRLCGVIDGIDGRVKWWCKWGYFGSDSGVMVW